MEARVSLHQDGDVLGVLLQEPRHRHHHVGLDVPGLLAVAKEHKVLAPRLYSETVMKPVSYFKVEYKCTVYFTWAVMALCWKETRALQAVLNAAGSCSMRLQSR